MKRSNLALSRIVTVAFIAAILETSSIIGYFVYYNYVTGSRGKGTVFVLYVGSLVNTLENSIGPEFEHNTGFGYQGEGHGSLQDVQMILGNQRTPDVFISAGTSPMRILQNRSHPIVSWWLSFVTDQLVIAYSSKSRFSSSLDMAKQGLIPWYTVLNENSFRFGVSDPTLDPKGVYVIEMFKLAARYHDNASLAHCVNSSHIQVFAEETLPVGAQTGAADAIIAYRHEAVEQNLSYISLPDQINLGNMSYSDYYSRVSTCVSGQEYIRSPITFTIAIPSTAKNPTGSFSILGIYLEQHYSERLA